MAKGHQDKVAVITGAAGGIQTAPGITNPLEKYRKSP